VAAIPVYTTFVAGTVVTAAELNNFNTAGNFWLARPYCDVENTTGPSMVAGTALLVVFDTENEDNDAMHSTSTNPSRIIFQTLGAFMLHPYFRVSTISTFTFTHNVRLNAAGSSSGGSSLSTITNTGQNQMERNFMYRAQNIGDYIELFATSSGTNTLGGGNRVTGCTALWELA
jgi:hypothetical protein